MNKSIFFYVFAVLGINSCHNTVNTYKNDLGINPATIAQMDTANYTLIEWEDTVRNFGTIIMGDTVLVRFQFKNSGDKVLFVSAAHSSCGCATVNYSREAVLPGDNGEVTATFRNKYPPGFVHQTIIVTTNTLGKLYHTLSFEGQSTDSSGLTK